MTFQEDLFGHISPKSGLNYTFHLTLEKGIQASWRDPLTVVENENKIIQQPF